MWCWRWTRCRSYGVQTLRVGIGASFTGSLRPQRTAVHIRPRPGARVLQKDHEHDSRSPSADRARPLRPLRSTGVRQGADRKSTRLNSSHVAISYAVFCLKKKKQDGPGEPTDPTHPDERDEPGEPCD